MIVYLALKADLGNPLEYKVPHILYFGSDFKDLDGWGGDFLLGEQSCFCLSSALLPYQKRIHHILDEVVYIFEDLHFIFFSLFHFINLHTNFILGRIVEANCCRSTGGLYIIEQNFNDSRRKGA